MNKKYNVCVVCNGNKSAIELGILIVSILINSEKDEFYSFHVITDDMLDNDKNYLLKLKEIKEFEINFYAPIKKNIEKYKMWVEKSHGKILPHWKHHVFIKLDVAHILNNLNEVLFLDTDMVVLKSLKDIFNTDLKDKWLLSTDQPAEIIKYLRKDGLKKLRIDEDKLDEHIEKSIENMKKTLKMYGAFDKSENDFISSGVLYLNLKALRDNIKETDIDNCFNKLVNCGLIFSDEAFWNNLVHIDKVIKFPESYNAYLAIWRKEEYSDVHIAHFTGGKLFESTSYYSTIMPEEKNKILLSAWKYFTYTQWFRDNPFYYMDLFSMYNINKLEYKINKLVSIIVWMIPFKKLRNKIRKMVEEASM